MKLQFLTAAIVTASVLSGCATHSINPSQSFQAKDLNPQVKSGVYQQKTNSFFIINDSSSSMGEIYNGAGFSGLANLSKHSIEKELLSRMNKTIPDVSLKSGLRSFGFGPCLSWGLTHLNQSVQSYSTASFDTAINSLTCSSGGTPLTSALEPALNDLTATTGNIALILLSDGQNHGPSPLPATEALKAQYGQKLCIYTIWVGNKKDESGKAVLEQISKVSGCGFSTTGSAIASSDKMADFVTKVFFNKVTPPVQEGDADKDGVLDSKDNCPDTPIGAFVNKYGCWIIEGINFDTNKSNIKAKYHSLLAKVANVINHNPGLKIEVQGHTDNQGSATYNLKLSDRRAKAVRDYLSSKTGNHRSLTAKGYGLTSPIDTNNTEAGRYNNRRVQLDVIK